jgi:hypothetical protein
VFSSVTALQHVITFVAILEVLPTFQQDDYEIFSYCVTKIRELRQFVLQSRDSKNNGATSKATRGPEISRK